VTRRIIRVGLDFDGVVAYNPFRIIRAPISFFKQNVLGIKTLHFFVPKYWWQKVLWLVVHESSVFPANGVKLLRALAADKRFEFYLITARFDCLKANTLRWIKKQGLDNVFKEILINESYEQPHIFKKRIVKEKKLDYYIEDNWDIVRNFDKEENTKVFWIYNILDLRRRYIYKFPQLRVALERILKDTSL
jgi:hypothetical protein